MLAAPRSGPPVSNAPPSFRSNTVVISPSPLAARLKKDSGSQKPPAGTSAGLAVTVALAFLALALALFTPPVSAAIVKRQAQIAVPGTCLNSSKISNGLLNRLEPPPGYKPMMGFGLDWLNDTAAKIDSRLGRRPSVIGGWVKIFPNQTWQDWNLYKMAMQVANAPRPPGSAPP